MVANDHSRWDSGRRIWSRPRSVWRRGADQPQPTCSPAGSDSNAGPNTNSNTNSAAPNTYAASTDAGPTRAYAYSRCDVRGRQRARPGVLRTTDRTVQRRLLELLAEPQRHVLVAQRRALLGLSWATVLMTSST